MDIKSEIQIELKRLKRHVNFLEKRFSWAVARDLAACLRNWVQLEMLVDAYLEGITGKKRFTHYSKPKIVKKIRASSPNFTSIPLPGGVKMKNMEISGVAYYEGVVTQDEFKAIYEAEKSSSTVTTGMKFSEWMSAEAYEFKTENGNLSISRKEFIDRAANLLGGTHPMSVQQEGDKEQWADKYILQLLNEQQVGHLPAPYAILLQAAQEITRVVS